MYRVVLIDDEKLIVEGLRKVIRWEEYNCQVVGTAEDAVQGAQIIRELSPHIVFTDIKMPGQDGLSMLAGLRSEFPDMQIAVLTGYREFSYAQEAIRLGVCRFLLKPSKLDEINEALSAMTDRLKRICPSEEVETPESTNAGSFIVKQAIAYMEKHYSDKLTLLEVAEACYVSQWHLSKLLNKYTEKNFYDILNNIRIEKAKELLSSPQLKIGDIGEMVGYSDTAHFARVFKKLTGMSANEFRNSIKW